MRTQPKYPVIDLKRTGENIKELREDGGLTVVELQRQFGFNTPQAIYRWQNGITLPSVDNLLILANVFGVKIDDILIVKQGV